MDEAMHPLAFMVVGLYGKVLPNQNGAPLRIHIPWKYGFKSGKSIVRIRFTDKQPDEHLGGADAARVRVLRQREPERAIIRAGRRSARRGCRAFANRDDADVQRLRRSGREPVRRAWTCKKY